MLHHLRHGHHQQDDIDLSKQSRIRIDRLHLDRHPVSVPGKAAGLLVNTDIMIVSSQPGTIGPSLNLIFEGKKHEQITRRIRATHH